MAGRCPALTPASGLRRWSSFPLFCVAGTGCRSRCRLALVCSRSGPHTRRVSAFPSRIDLATVATPPGSRTPRTPDPARSIPARSRRDPPDSTPVPTCQSSTSHRRHMSSGCCRGSGHSTSQARSCTCLRRPCSWDRTRDGQSRSRSRRLIPRNRSWGCRTPPSRTCLGSIDRTRRRNRSMARTARRTSTTSGRTVRPGTPCTGPRRTPGRPCRPSPRTGRWPRCRRSPRRRRSRSSRRCSD